MKQKVLVSAIAVAMGMGTSALYAGGGTDLDDIVIIDAAVEQVNAAFNDSPVNANVSITASASQDNAEINIGPGTGSLSYDAHVTIDISFGSATPVEFDEAILNVNADINVGSSISTQGVGAQNEGANFLGLENGSYSYSEAVNNDNNNGITFVDNESYYGFDYPGTWDTPDSTGQLNLAYNDDPINANVTISAYGWDGYADDPAASVDIYGTSISTVAAGAVNTGVNFAGVPTTTFVNLVNAACTSCNSDN